jgi:hypothetical protein
MTENMNNKILVRSITKEIIKFISSKKYESFDAIPALSNIICSSSAVIGMGVQEFSDMVDLMKLDFNEMKEIYDSEFNKK